MSAIGTRLLKVEIDGTEYSAQLTNYRFSAADADADTTTFSDAAAGGGKDWTMAFTAVQDTAADSMWDLVWSQAGATLPITVMPYGNDTPSTGQPHFTANATIAQFDGDFLGGDANASATAKFTFEASWQLDAKPTKVTA